MSFKISEDKTLIGSPLVDNFTIEYKLPEQCLGYQKIEECDTEYEQCIMADEGCIYAPKRCKEKKSYRWLILFFLIILVISYLFHRQCSSHTPRHFQEPNKAL